MAVILSRPLGNVGTTVGPAGYTTGTYPRSLPVALGSGTLFGSPSVAEPVRVSVITADSYGTADEVFTIYRCTEVNGDTLSVTPITSSSDPDDPDISTDREYEFGDIVEVRMTAGTIYDLNQIQKVGAVNPPIDISSTGDVDGSLSSAFIFNLASGSNTITLSNISVGQTVRLTTVQPSGSTGTISWSTSPVAIQWAGGTEGQATGTASRADVFLFYGVSGTSPPAANVVAGAVAFADFVAIQSSSAGIATHYDFEGPTRAPIGAISIPFTITPRKSPVLQSDGTYDSSAELYGTVTIEVTGGLTQTITKTFSGSSPQTFTITASSTSQIYLTPSNDQGLPDADPITCTGQTLTTLNLGSITNYHSLSDADTYYRLTGPVTSTRTAFAVGADNVTLDLNQQTVTYDNDTPVAVTNGGFETGTTSGWNVTGASSARIVAARPSMWGNYMLQLYNFSTVQVIESSSISIAQNDVTDGITYAASIIPKAGSNDTVIWLEVVDTVTSTVLGAFKRDSPDHGFGPVTEFTPTSNPVILRITVTPPSGGSDTVDFDYAALTRAYFYGLVTSRPNFVLTNGSITQGQGNSYSSSAVRYTGDTVTIDGITASVSSLDADLICGQYSNNFRIINSTIIGRQDRFTDRMSAHAAISIYKNTGYVDIQNNTIYGTMQAGIFLARDVADTSGVTVKGNLITHTSMCTEGYGILSNNRLYNFEIAYNTIMPVDNGRGILMDNVSNNGTVHHNYIEVMEGPNLEYTQTGMEAVALRVRPQPSGSPYPIQTEFPIQDVTFDSNHFIAHTGAGLDWACIGAKVQCFTTNSNVLFTNNLFKATATSIDSGLSGIRATSAWALTIPDATPDSAVTFIDNTFESNHKSLHIGDNETWGWVHDGVFINNTIKKSADYPGLYATYFGLDVGQWNTEVDSLKLLDMHYSGGATSAFTFEDYTATKEILYGYLMTVTVTHNGSRVSNAEVTVTDYYTNQSSGGPYYTGADGTVQIPGCVEKYSSDGSSGENATPVHTTLTPLLVTATSGSLTGSTSVTPGGDLAVSLAIN